MNRVICFLKSTKWVSRILFVIWIFSVAFMSTNMKQELFVDGSVGFAIFCYFCISLCFLGPVLLLEGKRLGLLKLKKKRAVLIEKEMPAFKSSINNKENDKDNSSVVDNECKGIYLTEQQINKIKYLLDYYIHFTL